MAHISPEISRTFNEFLLLPNLTTPDTIPSKISLKTPLVRYKKGLEESPISLNIPMVSAIMQSVSGPELATALAKSGGLSFIFASQSVENQAEMIRKVKKYKSGFVVSDSNLKIDALLSEALRLKKKTGHSTMAVTDDGTPNGKLMGILTSRDYRLSRVSLDTPVKDLMTPFDKLIYGYEGITLSEANDIIWDNKLNQLPIISEDGRLLSLVFRKDYEEHKENPDELLDGHKSYLVGAGINTRDYEERVPALVEAGADVLCIDSSDGFSVWQSQTLDWIRQRYGDRVYVGAGNVVDAEGFRYLADAGADFIKVGIGGGSICITREQKGIGCGQASAVMNVCKARDQYFEETGIYIPICSDGGIVYDYHMALALAMGADFLMLGRYFARFDESPTRRLMINNNYVKEYWGEGSNRARNWQRYDAGEPEEGMHFEEGVDSYVPYAGKLKDNVEITVAKIKATMSSCGSGDLETFHETARLVMVSATSIVEGGAHDVIKKDSDITS